MLDKTIPYYGVLMIKDNPTAYPKFQLPDNYSFCMYRVGFEDYWSELEFEVGEFDSIINAKKYFKNEFMKKQEELSKRCIFVKDKYGKFVATSSIWYGNDFGDESMERIHWVCVHPKHQGKGIAKALITKTLDVFNSLSHNNILYLTTQTWSYKAINIYLSFGFKPYMGTKPVNWISKKGDFNEENKNAWSIIFNKINAYPKKI